MIFCQDYIVLLLQQNIKFIIVKTSHFLKKILEDVPEFIFALTAGQGYLALESYYSDCLINIGHLERKFLLKRLMSIF